MTTAFMLTQLKKPTDEEIYIRQSFTKVTGLPDLSVYTGSPSERFRSITTPGDIFNIDPFAPDTDLSAIIYKKNGVK